MKEVEKSFTNKLVRINANGASANFGKHKGVSKLLKEKATWLQVIHCFNRQVELALKEAFKLALKEAFKTTAFEDIDTMLCNLCYLY